MAIKLSKKDMAILAKLEENARLHLKQMGKAAGLSPEAVAYRLSRMEGAGFILRYHTIINYFKVGLFKYKLYLRLKAPQPQAIERICTYLQSNPKSEWVAHLSGRWDIVAGFIVAKPNEFSDEVDKFMGEFSQHIQEKAVTQTLYLAHQSRRSMTKSESPSVVYHTALDAPRATDSLDRKILQVLANNARMPMKKIAQLAKTTPRKAAYRIKQLESDSIILAYKPHFEPKAFGRTFYKLTLRMKFMGKENLAKFVSFCGQLPDVVWPQQVLGSWDFEVDLDAPDAESLYSTLSKMYKAFPDAIIDYEQCAQIKEYKLDLFPGALPALVHK